MDVIGKELLYDIRNMLSEKTDVSSKEDLERRFPGVHINDNVFIGDNVKIDKSAAVDHNVVINDNVTIDKQVWIGRGSIIGKGSTLGHNAIINSGVSISDNVSIGDGAVINNGSKIKKNVSIPSSYNIKKDDAKLINPISKKKLEAIEKFIDNFDKRDLQRRIGMTRYTTNLLKIGMLINNLDTREFTLDFRLSNYVFNSDSKTYERNENAKDNIALDIELPPIYKKFLTFKSILPSIKKAFTFDVPPTLDDIYMTNVTATVIIFGKDLHNDERTYTETIQLIIDALQIASTK